jgi:hypothetical protein
MGHYARAVDRAAHAHGDHLVRTITTEFRQMPGLRLTRSQFQRLWHLDENQCRAVVQDLIGRNVLVEGPDGRLGRRPSTG